MKYFSFLQSKHPERGEILDPVDQANAKSILAVDERSMR
jgi:hypothetical protein